MKSRSIQEYFTLVGAIGAKNCFDQFGASRSRESGDPDNFTASNGKTNVPKFSFSRQVRDPQTGFSFRRRPRRKDLLQLASGHVSNYVRPRDFSPRI